MKVTIDTNILIWGIRKVATAGQEFMINKATDLIKRLRDTDDTVVLTAVTVGEFLAGADDETAKNEFETIQATFQILPFDGKAARIAAKLWRDRIKHHVAQKTKVELKADIQIVASAKAHGVNRIYSHDPQVRSFAAALFLDAFDVPPSKQSESKRSLFSNDGE